MFYIQGKPASVVPNHTVASMGRKKMRENAENGMQSIRALSSEWVATGFPCRSLRSTKSKIWMSVLSPFHSVITSGFWIPVLEKCHPVDCSVRSMEEQKTKTSPYALSQGQAMKSLNKPSNLEMEEKEVSVTCIGGGISKDARWHLSERNLWFLKCVLGKLSAECWLSKTPQKTIMLMWQSSQLTKLIIMTR